MQVKVTKQPKSTIKIDIKVPNIKVKEAYETLMTDIVKNSEVSGFRKGTAPRKMVESKTDVSKIYGDLINELLRAYYPRAIKENHIAPISNPKVEVKEFDIEKDFEFSAMVATRPDVKVGDYKKKLKKVYADKLKTAEKDKEEKLKKGEKLEPTHTHLLTTEVVDILLEISNIEIPDLLIDDETDRMMARLVDQTQAIGMSLDQYLKAQNKSAEELRTNYDKLSERNLKTEFILEHLIKEEKIEVNDAELEETAKASGDPKTSEGLKDPVQRWYIKSILEKNKLISKLIEEIEQSCK